MASSVLPFPGMGDTPPRPPHAFPIDDPPPPDTALLLDTEWKLRPDNTLLIKQIRPYLRRE